VTGKPVIPRERADYIDVWRVLHGKRDIARWMREPTDRDDT
jgi:plasmid stabilization system protein ParE